MSLADALYWSKSFTEKNSAPLLPEVYDRLIQDINNEIDKLNLKQNINICNGHGDENEYLLFQTQALNDSITLLYTTQIKQFNIEQILEDFNKFISTCFRQDLTASTYYKDGLDFVIKLLENLLE